MEEKAGVHSCQEEEIHRAWAWGRDAARCESNLFHYESGDRYVFILRFLYVKKES